MGVGWVRREFRDRLVGLVKLLCLDGKFLVKVLVGESSVIV